MLYTYAAVLNMPPDEEDAKSYVRFFYLFLFYLYNTKAEVSPLIKIESGFFS